DRVRAERRLQVGVVLLRGVVRARVAVGDAAGRLLDRSRDLAEVRVRRQELRLLERLRGVDEVLLRLEFRNVRRVAPRDRVRIFYIDLGDRVLVVPVVDELPGEILVLGLSVDVPARAETAVRERCTTVLGR